MAVTLTTIMCQVGYEGIAWVSEDVRGSRVTTQHRRKLLHFSQSSPAARGIVELIQQGKETTVHHRSIGLATQNTVSTNDLLAAHLGPARIDRE